jgi:flagellar basal-body rod modification protein FlgD
MPSIPSATNSSPAAGTQAAESGTNSAMGKDQFLKLFVAQLQHQDPMNPMQDSDFMGQMASFSTLEQVSNLASENARSNAIGLLGRTVTYKDKDGAEFTGTVEKVSTKDGKPSLTVGGATGVDPSSISQVS